jgi:hypothetical protein
VNQSGYQYQQQCVTAHSKIHDSFRTTNKATNKIVKEILKENFKPDIGHLD